MKLRVRVKGPLCCVLDHLSSAAIMARKNEEEHDAFGNSCGKVLMYELLTMCQPDPRNLHVAISTTGTPQTDWCGVEGEKLRGVVDVLAQSTLSDMAVIGEVK